MTLSPWQRNRAICIVCGAHAERRVTGNDGEPMIRNGRLGVDGNTITESYDETACVLHADALTQEVCDRLGSALGQNIREPWSYWLRLTPWRIQHRARMRLGLVSQSTRDLYRNGFAAETGVPSIDNAWIRANWLRRALRLWRTDRDQLA